jgi:hypothetical protein
MIPGVVEAGGGKVLATTSDDFNRANSTDITAAGKKWTETSGDWAITSNQLTTATAAASYPIATLRTNTKNATVKVDRANGDGWGVAFWVVDQNNWFAANTEMTQSSAQNPATSGSYQQTTFTGNTCSGGKSYNGDSSWPAYGGTCYDVVCTSYSGGTPATYAWLTPSGMGCCYDGIHCGNGIVVCGYSGGMEAACGGTCCCTYTMTSAGTPASCNAYQIQNCCVYLDATDSGCPGSCNGQSPRPQYSTTTVNYTNPETRTWTYSQKAIIRKAVAGTVSVVANTSTVTSTETVGAAVAASSPTRPTSLTVTLVGEVITVSAPGAAGGTITGSHTATGANRGKKHGVSIAPATVSQSNAVDNFVYTKP